MEVHLLFLLLVYGSLEKEKDQNCLSVVWKFIGCSVLVVYSSTEQEKDEILCLQCGSPSPLLSASVVWSFGYRSCAQRWKRLKCHWYS